MSLILKPVTANLTRNTEHFSKMDPYVLFQIGSNVAKSQVHKQGGKHPQWHETITLQTTQLMHMKVSVMEKDKLKDDLVGEAYIELGKYIMDRTEHEQIIPLTYKGDNSGTLTLKVSYVGEDGDKQKWTQQNGGWNNTNMQSGWGNMPNNSEWGKHNPSAFDEFNKKN